MRLLHYHDVRADSSAKERTSTGLNRLAIVAVPVQRANPDEELPDVARPPSAGAS